MTTLFLRKIHNVFIPADAITQAEMETMHDCEYKAEVTKPRNYPFLKKFFALVKVAFDAWEGPETEYKGMPVEKNLERFRKDLLIMAGYGYPVVNIAGNVEFEAKSIAFGSMDETEFSELYSKVIDVILSNVLNHYTRDDLDVMVNNILRFS